MKKIAIIICILINSSLLLAQEEIEKNKPKHFNGTWYSIDRLIDIKTKPIITFMKDSSSYMNVALETTMKVSNDYIYIYRKTNNSIDTLRVLWAFVKESKNFKIIEKHNTGEKLPITTTTADGIGPTTTNLDIFINKTTTYHVESMTENKMILKYIK